MPLLEIEDLTVEFATTSGRFRAVDREMGQIFACLTSKEQDDLIRLFEKLLV